MRRKQRCTCESQGPNGPRHYKVVRMFMMREHSTRTIKGNLTLGDAQAHCTDPETSSRTATTARAKRYTERMGPWFDGYEHE
jgi:hypothetical protein